jgi:hypothetical protein
VACGAAGVAATLTVLHSFGAKPKKAAGDDDDGAAGAASAAPAKRGRKAKPKPPADPDAPKASPKKRGACGVRMS